MTTVADWLWLGVPTLRAQVMLANTRTTREAEQHSREAALEASAAEAGAPGWEQRAAQGAAVGRGGGGGGGNSGGGGSGRSSYSGTGTGGGGAGAPPPLHTVTMTPKWQVQNRVGGGGLYNLDGTAPHGTAGPGAGPGPGLGASLPSVGSSQHANGTAGGPGGGAAAGARSEAVDLVYLRNVLLKFLEAHAAGRSQERDLLLPAVATLLQVGRGPVWGPGDVSRSVWAGSVWVSAGLRGPGTCMRLLRFLHRYTATTPLLPLHARVWYVGLGGGCRWSEDLCVALVVKIKAIEAWAVPSAVVGQAGVSGLGGCGGEGRSGWCAGAMSAAGLRHCSLLLESHM